MAHEVTGGAHGRRLLGVLLSFDAARPVLTVAELASSTDIPVSTAYRYVALLREEGLLERDPGVEGGYRLGPRAAALGRAAAATDAVLLAAAHPRVVALRDALDETVVLVRPAGDAAVVCIDRAESRRPAKVAPELGQVTPRGAGAAAMALDAEQGWTEDIGGLDDGVWGCAAAVLERGRVVAALGVAGPAFRLDESARFAAIAAVRQAAEAVTRDLEAEGA